MIDTAHIEVPVNMKAGGVRLYEPLLEKLSGVVSSYKKEFPIYGKLKNLKVSIYEKRLRIKGSIPKFYQGHNFSALSPRELHEAFLVLSDILQVDVLKGKVTRLDFGDTVITDYVPITYLPYFDYFPGLDRYEKADSLYFSDNKSFTINFYDKIKEAKRHRMLVPSEFLDRNVLRIECRLSKSINSFLNQPIITTSQLSDPIMYNQLISFWEERINQIVKVPSMEFNLEAIKTPKDLGLCLQMMGIIFFGGIDKVNKLIDQLKRLSTMGHSKAYLRARKLVNKLSDFQIHCVPNELLMELDSKIHLRVEQLKLLSSDVVTL